MLAISELDHWFSRWSGGWRTAGWWNWANILTTIIRFERLSGDKTHRKLLHSVFRQSWWHRRSFLNQYYDDEGWWASAWLDAYGLTGEERYLAMAERIYADIRCGWSEECEGGVFWKKGEPYKAAISNSLFIYTGARLYSAAGEEAYLREAQRGWDWFTASGLISSEGLVRDGLGRDCGLATDLWTYNQGMLIGAAVSLSRVSPQEGRAPDPFIEAALLTARGAIGSMARTDGVLSERGEPNLNGDSVQFKGILMRFLSDLWLASPDETIRDFILTNANSLWANAKRMNTYQVGACWRGPFDSADAARQGSALDALVAAAAVAPD